VNFTSLVRFVYSFEDGTGLVHNARADALSWKICIGQCEKNTE